MKYGTPVLVARVTFKLDLPNNSYAPHNVSHVFFTLNLRWRVGLGPTSRKGDIGVLVADSWLEVPEPLYRPCFVHGDSGPLERKFIFDYETVRFDGRLEMWQLGLVQALEGSVVRGDKVLLSLGLTVNREQLGRPFSLGDLPEVGTWIGRNHSRHLRVLPSTCAIAVRKTIDFLL
jgi:hypothetical protein